MMHSSFCLLFVLALLVSGLNIPSIANQKHFSGLSPISGGKSVAQTIVHITTTSITTPFTTWKLDLLLKIHESNQTCGYGNVTINDQQLPQAQRGEATEGNGSISTLKNHNISATWTFKCLNATTSNHSQLLKFKIEAVDGVQVEESGYSLSFSQTGTPRIIRGIAHNAKSFTHSESQPGLITTVSLISTISSKKAPIITAAVIASLLTVVCLVLCCTRIRRQRRFALRREDIESKDFVPFEGYHDLEKLVASEKNEVQEDEFEGFKRAVELVDSMIAAKDSRVQHDSRTWHQQESQEERPPAYRFLDA